MRRVAALLAISALAIAGCGGDDGGEATGPLDDALGYLPEDAPLVITIDSDVDGDQFKALESIAEKFPGGGELREQLLQQLELGGSDFEEDVQPILGNPFVVGATDVDSIIDDAEADNFVGAIESRDRDALESAVEKEGAEESGEKNGATIYEDSDGDPFAIEDDVLVVASSSELLDQALEQRDADDRLTEDRFAEGLEGLPEDALLKVYGDIGALLEGDPSTEDARKVKWVAALDTFGMTAAVQEDEIAIDFNLATDGDLSDEDLPLASGSESPGIVQREGEIGVGVRDLDQIFKFGESAAQAISPQSFSEYETAKKQIDDELGVSVSDDIFGQLDGDLSVSYDIGGGYAGRAELKDPAAFRETLEKAAPAIPSLVQGTTGGLDTPRLVKPRGGDGLYSIVQPGSDTIYFGVLNDLFVVSNEARRAQQVAVADPEPVEGADGALVYNVNAEALADALLAQLGGLEALGGQLFTGTLGNLSGSMESSTDGLSGNLKLGID